MKITANFNGGNNQFEIYNGPDGITPALNGLQYTNFQCDVRFDPIPAGYTANLPAPPVTLVDGNFSVPVRFHCIQIGP